MDFFEIFETPCSKLESFVLKGFHSIALLYTIYNQFFPTFFSTFVLAADARNRAQRAEVPVSDLLEKRQTRGGVAGEGRGQLETQRTGHTKSADLREIQDQSCGPGLVNNSNLLWH